VESITLKFSLIKASSLRLEYADQPSQI